MNRKTYNYKDVYAKTLEYFKGDDLATNVWITKYALKELKGDESHNDGTFEDIIYYEQSPKDMFHRIASELHRAGLKYGNPFTYEEIYELVDDFKYIVPQGRPMAGIGNTNDITSISNCFVVSYPTQDSYGTICRVDQEIAQISKRGGGIGTDLSGYRQANSKVKNAAMTSTGPIEICANRFSNTIREVGQNGRRGALMLSMDIEHPDSEKLIDAKMEEGKITGANISMKISDSWLKSFIDNKTPDTEKERLWLKIINNAWQSAEPGVLFWSTILNESVPDCYSDYGYRTLSTNPCGEIPLSNKDSCRLMLINLYSYVVNPFSENPTFNFGLFKEHARKIVKLMDNMIDLEIEKIESIIAKVKSDPEDSETKAIELNLWEEIKNVAILGRRSGIGITGEADMLAAMNLKYGTPEATEFAVNVHKILTTNVYIGSCDLVQIDERPAFGCFNWSLEMNNPFIQRLISINDNDAKELADKIKNGRRNIALLTIPPAGTTSLMTQTTSGIEPLFLPYYNRRRKIDKNSGIKADFIDTNGDWFVEYIVIHDKFAIWYSVVNNITKEEAVERFQKIAKDDISKLDELFRLSPYYKATSADINWVEKVKMQGAIQKFVDHSISATTNIPKETSVEVVRDIYETAWRSGCKGMTIYRDGSRSGILTSAKENKEVKEPKVYESKVKKRPKSVKGKVVRFNNGGEKWVSVVGIIDDEPYEIFAGLLDKLNIPKYVEDGFIVKEKEVKLELNENNQEVETLVSRYDFHYKNKDGENMIVIGLSKTFKEEYWNYAKLISGLLRNKMPIQYVVKTIESLNLNTDNINTWKNGIIRTLKKFIKEEIATDEKCSQCGAQMVREGGCLVCKSCGHSKCN